MAIGRTQPQNDYVPKGMLGLLFIEPKSKPSDQPVIDNITRRMTNAFRIAAAIEPNTRYRGFHVCSCGIPSSNRDYFFKTLVLNSLCIHYLAFHRKEVPPQDIELIQEILPDDEAEPTPEELRCHHTNAPLTGCINDTKDMANFLSQKRGKHEPS